MRDKREGLGKFTNMMENRQENGEFCLLGFLSVR